MSFGLVASGMALATVPAQADDAESSLSVTTLEVENRTEPLGIDVAAPRFSWIIDTNERDVTQTSYRVRVATNAAHLDGGEVWDSGTVTSEQSRSVEYDGEKLAAGTTYYWRVDVQTSAGEATAESTFATGFFTEEDWSGSKWIGRERAEEALSFTGAKWIWTPEASANPPGEDRAFRKTLVTPEGKEAAQAEIIITADDSFTLWANGNLLGQTTGLENEWQGAKRFVVDLETARNTFAVRTTNGANSPAGLLMAAQVTYNDGSRESFTTDSSWKAVKAIPSGFETTGFDDAAWPAAVVQAEYGAGPWGDGVSLPEEVAPAPLMRKEFSVDAQIESAKIYVAAGGYANVSLNGAPINDEILSPGFTDYDDHVQYTVTDITDQLHEGANALGMELGRGFYGMTNGNVWNWQNAPWHDDPVARAVVRIEYTDGTTSDIVTDSSWTLHDGPTVIDDLYGGETYDASKVQTGFDTVGFVDSGWVQASEVAGPKGELINQQQQPIRVTERLPAESITEPADGVYVVKFPRILAGNVEFTVEGEAGTTIRAQYGEKLRDNGRPNFSNNGGFQNGFQTDTFILAGSGEPETWAATFSYKGFQYIEVTGWPGDEAPPLSAFTAEVLHTDAPETGSFESSETVMNKTHRAVVDTLLNNLHGIPTDTPMFEKNGWTGDAAVGAEMFLMNLDTQNLFEKWIGDINDTRDENGAPLVIAPSSGDWGQWGVAPPWHSAYILIPWWLYQYGGDIRVLEQYYDGMKTYVDLEYDRSPGGVVPESRLGDWVSPEASPAGGNAPEDTRVSATAYLYTMLISMEKTANLLGKTADAAHFADNAVVVKEGFNETFLDSDAGYYRGKGDRGYRQTHNVLALEFGLAPDEAMAERVAASIAADVRAKGTTLNTGVLGTKSLLPVLTDYGYAELAYELAVQTEYPSWGYMIENGATSMWEHWSLDARSRGHYFLGTVDDWFYHYVAGIRSSELTGYRDITIQPAVTDQLEWAKAETQTPFGPVSVDWKKTGEALSLHTHVPVGSTAVVHLPAANSWAVTEGGLPLDEVEGVHSVAHDGADVLVTIGSGDYSFDVDPTAGAVGAVIDSIQQIQDHADVELANEMLNAQQHSDLSALVAEARESAGSALRLVEAGDSVATAEKLATALVALDELDSQLEELQSPPETVAALADKSADAREAAESTITALLGIEASVTLDAEGYKPGMSGTATASVDNGGESVIEQVTATWTRLPEEWATTPDGPAQVAETVDAGATATAELGFTVPLEQLPVDVPAGVDYAYRFADATVRLPTALTINVDSPVTMTSVVLDPETAVPGAQTTLSATVRNNGTEPALGHLEVSVPDGWVAPLPTADVIVPAGGESVLNTPVFVPLGADAADVDAVLTAGFVYNGVSFASGTATLGVTLADAPDQPGYDHIDLGDATAEQEHNLTASESSGTSREAGLTRRYAGHLTDFSYFEFDATVIPGEPFMIRAIETYDRAQTKRYKIYVDDTEVFERQFSHMTGVGTETFEFRVDAAHATDSTVRIRFETQDNHSFYDPSVADVWTMPVSPDTVAPQVVATADPAAPDRSTGWYTSVPVAVSVDAQDDREGEVSVEYALADAELAAYTDPITLDDDGAHKVRFRGTDAAGNISATGDLTVAIDTAAPETTATRADGFEGDIAENAGTVEFSASDATSGVESTSYRLNGGEWQIGESLTVTDEGEFTIQYFSTDAAGNAESVKSVSGTVVIPDTTAPTVAASISKPGANGWHLADAAVTITAEDAESGVASMEYHLGDGDWAAYSAPVVLPEGKTLVTFRASDAEGNVSEVSSIEVRVDATAAEIWGWLSDDGHVTTIGSDEGSGVERIEYSIDGETWITRLSSLIAEEATPTSVRVRTVDRAGNTGDVRALERTGAPSGFTVEPGARVLIESSGFESGQSVRVELHSDPIVLATVMANDHGVVSTFVTIPADIEPNAHTLVLVVEDGTGPGGDGSVEIPTEIAETGADSGPWLLLAGVALLAGLVLTVWSRRKLATR